MNERRAIAITVVLATTFAACAERVSSLAPLVTRDGIRAIKVGMTREEVEAILGTPITFSKEYADSDSDRWHLMTYSRTAFGGMWYPMLWVHLEDGRVSSVYAKAYASDMSERGLYCHSESENWETPEFQRMFPK